MPSKTTQYFPPFSTTRKQYNGGGSLIATLVTNHPVPNARYHPKWKRNYRDWGRTVNYKTKRATQGYLTTLSLTHDFTGVSGEWIFNNFRDPASQARYELQYGHIAIPQSVDYVENQIGAALVAIRTQLEADVQYKCLSKARDMRINLPVFFGEGHQTVKMLTETAKTLASAYRAFRKGRWKQAAKHLGIDKPSKATANNWLAYQYGWKPLLSDAVGAATMLHDYFEGNKKWGNRFRVNSSSKSNSVSGSLILGNNYSIPGWYDEASWTRDIVVRGGLLLELEYTSAALAASLGVGLTDPLLTAWELTPFSFVFDWFVDVGGWLEARSSLQGCKVLAGYLSTLTTYSGYTKMKYGSGTYSKVDSQPSPWNWNTRRYYRRSWTGGVSTLRTPLFDGLSADRLKTAAALFRQRFIGDRNPSDPYPLSPASRRKFAKY